MKFDKKFKQIIQKLTDTDDESCQIIKDELTELSDIYQKRNDRFEKILKLSDAQEKSIMKMHNELERYKNSLEEQVKEEIAKRESQELYMMEQSRLASIAEMMDAIAHQWKQPLNLISLYVSTLQMRAWRNEGASTEEVNDLKENVSKQLNYMTETLQSFRSFFRPVTKPTLFSVESAISSVLRLMSDDLISNSIEIVLDVKSDFKLIGNENEFRHIIINFISNSKYVFLQKNISNRKITIVVDGENKTVTVTDNGGGIDESIIDKVFEANVTTKGKDGTGIGLYMSQKIAQKHGGKLLAQNTPEGAKFIFTLEDEQNVD